MRRSWFFLLLSLFSLSLVVVGCPTAGDDDDSGDDDDATADDDDSTTGDDDDATGDDDDATGDDDDATGDDDDSAGSIFPLAGIVIDAEGSFGGLAGATVQSVDDPSTAVTTGSDGLYEVEVPIGEFAVEALFNGRYTVVVTGHTDDQGTDEAAPLHTMMATSSVDDMVSALNVTQDAGNGMVWVSVLNPNNDQPVAGSDTAISATNDGAVQVGKSGASTGSEIGNDTFIVMYANVPPGASDVTVTPPSGVACTGNSSTTVFAGKASYVTWFCE